MKLVILMNFLIISVVYGTIFRPLSIKSQIVYADNIYVGEVVSVTSEEDEGGIFSKIFLKLDKWHGENVEHGHVELYIPGGKLGDRVQKIEGNVEVSIGEKVVLLSKTIAGRSWIMNLGLGKFSIKTLGKSEILVNQIYPNKPNVGQIKIEKFLALVRTVKGEKLKERYKNKYEIVVDKEQRVEDIRKGASRNIASLKNKTKEKQNINSLWLVFLLSILGFVVRLNTKRES